MKEGVRESIRVGTSNNELADCLGLSLGLRRESSAEGQARERKIHNYGTSKTWLEIGVGNRMQWNGMEFSPFFFF